MGIVFRQSVKTTIVILAGSVLGALLIFLSTYMVPDKQQLGFTRTLVNQAAVASQVLLFGLHGTLAVFIHRFTNEDKRRQVLIGICISLPVIFIAITSLAYFLLKEPVLQLFFQPQDVPFMRRYLLWLPLFVCFFAYQVLLEQYLISQMKIAIATFTREIVLRVLNIALILLFGYGFINFDWLVGGTVLTYAVPWLVMLYLARRTKGWGISFDFKAFTRKEYFEIAHFAWYHTLLSASSSLMGLLDSLMVASVDKDGLSSVAVYTVSVFIISVLLIPHKAMTQASFPDLAKAFKDNDMERARDVYMRSSINILIASVGMILLVCCSLPNLTSILPEGYEAVTVLVLILLIGRFVDMATGMNDQLITVSPYYKFNFYMSIMLVVFMMVFNRLLIPVYGIYGAAWGTSIAFTLYNLGKLIFVYAKTKIQPFTRNSLLTIGAGLAALIPGYLLPFVYNPYIDTIARSAVIVIVYLGMLLWLKPSKDLREYLNNVKKNKRLF